MLIVQKIPYILFSFLFTFKNYTFFQGLNIISPTETIIIVKLSVCRNINVETTQTTANFL